MRNAPATLAPTLLVAALGTLIGLPALAQPGTVLAHQKISETTGSFTGDLDDLDYFGHSVASLGDLDGDGVADLAVGAFGNDSYLGAVWVLFLNADGTVRAHQKIARNEGGFTGDVDRQDYFGVSVAAVGDLDGDGVTDLAVGADGDDDGGNNPLAEYGAVWVLFLRADGTVRAYQKISQTAGGFTGDLDDIDGFGVSLDALGDLDGDGVTELAVGADGDDDGGISRGAVWVLFLSPDGTVKAHQKISDTEGGFTGNLDDFDRFGKSVSPVGDLDGDGILDLAVGVSDQERSSSQGAVWVLFLNADGTVRAQQKISETEGGFTGELEDYDFFGNSLAPLGDLNGDGIPDLALGANGDDDGDFEQGAVWMLFLNADGTVAAHQKVSDTEGGFTGDLNYFDYFGRSVSPVGDLNGDGILDLAVGAPLDDDGGSHPDADHGAVWVLFLDGVPSSGALTVEAEPVSPPVVIPATGGTFSYTVTTTNSTAVTQTFELWTRVTRPNGQQTGALRGPITYTLAPGASVTDELRQSVPGRLAPGTYTYIAYVGTFPDDVLASEAFTFTKTGAALAGRETTGDEALWQEVDESAQANAEGGVPEAFALQAARPNPFVGRTTLRYDLPEAAEVHLAVYDVLGREVALLVDAPREAGHHEAVFDGADLPSGVYLVRLEAGEQAVTERLTVLK